MMTQGKFYARVGAIEMSLTDNGQKGRLRIEVPGVAAPVAVAIDVGSSALDSIILELAKLRAHLKPEHSKTAAPQGVQTGFPNPPWHVSDDAMTGGANLSICHPGFGWLTFQLPKPEAGNLGKLLTQIAELPAAPTGPKN